MPNADAARRARSGSRESSELKLSMLDRRDVSPVGYYRISKTSGKDVLRDEIVKGYEYEEGHYLVMTDEDFRLANAKATQTVYILGFTKSGTIPAFVSDAVMPDGIDVRERPRSEGSRRHADFFAKHSILGFHLSPHIDLNPRKAKAKACDLGLDIINIMRGYSEDSAKIRHRRIWRFSGESH